MEKRYSMTAAVPTYAVDPTATLRPSALLRWQQEIGEQQFTELGLSCRELFERSMAFVVTRLRVRFHRLPTVGERVTLTTWHRETRGVQMFRCYTLCDENGTPLTEGVTAFALVDAKEHRLLRPSALGAEVPTDPTKNGCPDPKKETPPPLIEIAALRPRYSELDQNGHVNNTCYADYICDNLPSGMDRKRLFELAICFEREVRFADRLTLSAAEVREETENGTGGTVWMAGEHNRGTAFVGRLCYEDDYVRHF